MSAAPIAAVLGDAQQLPKNAIDHNGTALLGGVGSDADDRSYVLAVLCAAYCIARGERQRIQTDLDFLVGIARALEADIYEPGFAIERAREHGLVRWADGEVES